MNKKEAPNNNKEGAQVAGRAGGWNLSPRKNMQQLLSSPIAKKSAKLFSLKSPQLKQQQRVSRRHQARPKEECDVESEDLELCKYLFGER
jgi:hypothetical protein